MTRAPRYKLGKPIEVRVDADVEAMLDYLAGVQNRSIHEIVREVVTEWVQSKEYRLAIRDAEAEHDGRAGDLYIKHRTRRASDKQI